MPVAGNPGIDYTRPHMSNSPTGMVLRTQTKNTRPKLLTQKKKKTPPTENAPSNAAIETCIGRILSELGEDPARQGLLDTPKRYARAMRFFTSGYEADLKRIVGNALFDDPSSEIVLVRDIEMFSLCEHHLVPFYGRAHIAYIPNGKIIGLSKIPRILDAFARRLQVQERLTTQVSEALMKILKPLGVAVVIEAYHLCMVMRGVQKQNSKTVTSSMQGVFRDDEKTRKELLHLLK